MSKVKNELRPPPKNFSRKALAQWLIKSAQKSQKHLQNVFRAKRWRLGYLNQRQSHPRKIVAQSSRAMANKLHAKVSKTLAKFFSRKPLET